MTIEKLNITHKISQINDNTANKLNQSDKAETSSYKPNKSEDSEQMLVASNLDYTVEEFDKKKYTEEEYDAFAQQLSDAMAGFGADKKAMLDVLQNEDLNSYDILMIAKSYRENNRTYLTNDIKKEFFKKSEDELLEIFKQATIECLQSDDPMARHQAEYVLRIEQGLIDYMSAGQKDDDSLNIRTSTMIMGIRG